MVYGEVEFYGEWNHFQSNTYYSVLAVESPVTECTLVLGFILKEELGLPKA